MTLTVSMRRLRATANATKNHVSHRGMFAEGGYSTGVAGNTIGTISKTRTRITERTGRKHNP